MNEDVKKRATEILSALKLEEKKSRIKELEIESGDAKFWTNHEIATVKMKELTALQNEVKEGEDLELLILEEQEELLIPEIKRLEFALYLCGPYDKKHAIMSLHAGQGGTEAMDWTEMLSRMYRRYIERKGWEIEEIDYTAGDEAGIKSVTYEVKGQYAFGFLKAEAGVHRLVRQSPFNADNLRQTSFAMAVVLPDLDDENNIVDLKEEDLIWDFHRAGGKGGQNVNKVSTAVRLTHTPSGITVKCSTERYQGQNREYALKLLRAKLWAQKIEAANELKDQLRGGFVVPGWGNQIRSYVLHPYHMVKDLRTNVETTHTDKVLDGEIEEFILAYLKKIYV
jgi:peptide chain release factor 2